VIVTPKNATLFVNDSQLAADAKENLKTAGWEAAPYEDIIKHLEDVGLKIKDVANDQEEQETQDGDEVETKGEGHGVRPP
jgi:hypothetical protein